MLFSRDFLPKNLRMLRKESGRSQEYMAKQLGISRSCLANYELGNREPDNDMLLRMADVYHVLIDFLMGRTECRTIDYAPEELRCFAKIRSLANRPLLLNLSPLPEEAQNTLRDYYEHFLARSQEEATEASGTAG